MEKINKHNYEAFFLDYYEKNLSAEQVAELMLFLENNPLLKEEFEEYEEIILEPETGIKFSDKNLLKKEVFKTVGNITSENYEDYIISDLEKQITLTDKTELNAFLKQNPNAKKDYKLYQLTFLKPDLSIVFPDKKNLKKPVVKTIRPIVRRLYYSIAIAASILIAVGLFIANNNNSERNGDYSLANRDAKFNIPEREIYPNDEVFTAEAPIRKKVNKVNKDKNEQKKVEKRENIILKKAFVKNNVHIASNIDNLLPEIDYNFDIYNNIEYLKLYNKYNTGNELASTEGDKANFQDLKNYVSAGVNKFINPENTNTDSVRQLNGWDIADIGLSGLNRISKQNFEIKKQKAEDGTVQSYTFSANNFEFSRKKKKKY